MNLVSRSIKLGLRAKLTLLIEGIVIILVLVTGFITTIREKETLENELRKRGLALASDLAHFLTRPLLSHDLPTLRRYVNQSMTQDYVRYVVVLDPHGKVVMHSDLSEVGKTYTDSLSMAALKSGQPGYVDIRASQNGELHSDMFTPIQISDIRLGTVRLGYSHMAVEKEITEARQHIFIISLLTAAGGGVFAYLLAIFISAPIKRITDATGKVANGYLDTQVRIRRNDEIGTLADAFNRMTDDLQRTTVSKDYVDNIIGSMNDTLIVVGPDAKIRSVNKATCLLLEYEEVELMGKDLDLIMPHRETVITGEGLQKPGGGPTIVNGEREYLTRSGKRIPMLFSSSALINKEGKVEGAVCIARDVTERKEAEDALRASEKELHYLSSQLLTAQEKERKRLSIELHDELGQSLMVLKLKLRSIQEGLQGDQVRIRAECDEGIAYINGVIENVRRLSRDLSPSILENLGFSAAIRWLVDAFTNHTKIGCSLDMGNIDDAFSEEEEITIYRMIQECLTNIAKHAQATRVSLVIREQKGYVSFRLQDNGKGFNVRKALNKDPGKKGLGLAALYERTRMLGGSIDISSREGEGTSITFTVPLDGGGYRT